MFNKAECQISFTKKNEKPIVKLLNQFVQGLPSAIKSIDACFIKDDDLYLFNKNNLIIAGRTGDKFKVSRIENIQDFVINWPYTWGSGDVSGADYDAKNKIIYLYKNREVLKINQRNVSETLPEKLLLNWQEIKQ